MCDKLREHVSRLYGLGIAHGDLFLKNIIVSGDRLFLVDWAFGALRGVDAGMAWLAWDEVKRRDMEGYRYCEERGGVEYICDKLNDCYGM